MLKEIDMASRTPKRSKAGLARSIARGKVKVTNPDAFRLPLWIVETYTGIDMPFKVLTAVLLMMIGFSFGGFVQDQLFTETTFFASSFFIEDGLLTGEWM